MNRKMIVAAAAIFAVSLTIISFSGLFTARAPPAEPIVKYTVQVDIDYIPLGVFDEWEGLNVSCSVMETRQVGPDGKEFIIHQPGGPLHYGALVLRRGISSNYDTLEWMSSTHTGTFERRNVSVHVHDEALVDIVIFDLSGAWPSSWSLSSGPKGTIIEELVIQYDSLTISE